METEKASPVYFTPACICWWMHFYTVYWHSVFPYAVRVACKNVVTALVTELHSFSLPQDALVKPKTKFFNKHQLFPPHHCENKRKHKQLDKWALGMEEHISEFGAKDWKAVMKHAEHVVTWGFLGSQMGALALLFPCTALPLNPPAWLGSNPNCVLVIFLMSLLQLSCLLLQAPCYITTPRDLEQVRRHTSARWCILWLTTQYGVAWKGSQVSQ